MKRTILIFGGVVFILVGVLTVVAFFFIKSMERRYNELKIKPAKEKRWPKPGINGEADEPVQEAQVVENKIQES